MKLLLKVALALALTVCLFFEGWTLLFDRPTPPQRGVMEQTLHPNPQSHLLQAGLPPPGMQSPGGVCPALPAL